MENNNKNIGNDINTDEVLKLTISERVIKAHEYFSDNEIKKSEVCKLFHIKVEAFVKNQAFSKKEALKIYNSNQQNKNIPRWIQERRELIINNKIKQSNIITMMKRAFHLQNQKNKVCIIVKDGNNEIRQAFVRRQNQTSHFTIVGGITATGEKLEMVSILQKPKTQNWSVEYDLSIGHIEINETGYRKEDASFVVKPKTYQILSFYAWCSAATPVNIMEAWNKTCIFSWRPTQRLDKSLIPQPIENDNNICISLVHITADNSLMELNDIPLEEAKLIQSSLMRNGGTLTYKYNPDCVKLVRSVSSGNNSTTEIL
ncbi:hypothetical protein ACTFIW_003654 [Dictyostelium discoideum]